MSKIKDLRPTLVEVDLSRGQGSKHPDVKCNGEQYLALIAGVFYCGEFIEYKNHLGFSSGWGVSGHQFDTPGYNCSRWEGLWEIVREEQR